MRIAINLSGAVAGGGLTNTVNLLQSLAEVDNHNEYVILTKNSMKSFFHVNKKNFDYYIIPTLADLSVPFRFLWDQTILPIMLRKLKIDLLLSAVGNIVPLVLPGQCKLIAMYRTSVLSSTFTSEISLRAKLQFHLLKTLTISSANRADKVICISKSTMKELAAYLKDAQKLETVYFGVGKQFTVKDKLEAKAYCSRNFFINKNFILSVSNIYKHKNFVRLIEAFYIIRERFKVDVQLVIAGASFDTDYYNEMLQLIDRRKLNKQVILLGPIPYDKLPNLYSAAELYVFPSVCETYGVTPIEAMVSGMSVVTSNIEPMPEISGKAALYFNPYDVEEIAEAMYQVLDNSDLREKLIEKGLERAQHFSWEKTARKMLTIFEEVSTLD